MSSLADRLAQVDERIAARLKAAGRSQHEITRIVISKFHPASLVRELAALGVRDFGENRDQEASAKALELTDLALNWHFVGQLQSKKAKSVLNYAKTIHSLDRDSLLESLSKAVRERGEGVEVFIQMNLTSDPGRGGINPQDLLPFAERVLDEPLLKLKGVMAVASLDGEEERDFAAVAVASRSLQTLSSEAKYISAGMSGDFELAIDYGATHLRIGTAITGNRAA